MLADGGRFSLAAVFVTFTYYVRCTEVVWEFNQIYRNIESQLSTAAQFTELILPLLLVSVAPLMIASFAFNFNNFNNIYLLTQGGPAMGDSPIAGATDILISYTYKIAFQAGSGAQYGLAAAVSIFIFFIVAGISAISFWRTRTLEDIR